MRHWDDWDVVTAAETGAPLSSALSTPLLFSPFLLLLRAADIRGLRLSPCTALAPALRHSGAPSRDTFPSDANERQRESPISRREYWFWILVKQRLNALEVNRLQLFHLRG